MAETSIPIAWRWFFSTIILIIGFSAVLIAQRRSAKEREEVHAAEMRIVARAVLECQDTRETLLWDAKHPMRILVRAATQEPMIKSLQRAEHMLTMICGDSILIEERTKRDLGRDHRAQEALRQ